MRLATCLPCPGIAVRCSRTMGKKEKNVQSASEVMIEVTAWEVQCSSV